MSCRTGDPKPARPTVTVFCCCVSVPKSLCLWPCERWEEIMKISKAGHKWEEICKITLARKRGRPGKLSGRANKALWTLHTLRYCFNWLTNVLLMSVISKLEAGCGQDGGGRKGNLQQTRHGRGESSCLLLKPLRATSPEGCKRLEKWQGNE